MIYKCNYNPKMWIQLCAAHRNSQLHVKSHHTLQHKLSSTPLLNQQAHQTWTSYNSLAIMSLLLSADKHITQLGRGIHMTHFILYQEAAPKEPRPTQFSSHSLYINFLLLLPASTSEWQGWETAYDTAIWTLSLNLSTPLQTKTTKQFN